MVSAVTDVCLSPGDGVSAEENEHRWFKNLQPTVHCSFSKVGSFAGNKCM